MPGEEKKDSQASTEESEEKKVEEKVEEKEESTEEKIYPDGQEEKKVEEKEDKKEEKEEKEEKPEEKKEEKKEDKKEELPSITELQDAAITAVEKWQADPTPENKKLADKAVYDAREAVESTKKAEIKYDVKLPENSLLSEESVEEIVSYARERGFSNEIAQALVEKKSEGALQNNAEVLKRADELINVTWPLEASKDKEIGGDDFGKNAEMAKRVLKKYAPLEFIKVLDQPSEKNPDGQGFGNHPGLLKTFVRIGKAMSDDQLIVSKGHGGEKREIADVFYGDSKPDSEKT